MTDVCMDVPGNPGGFGDRRRMVELAHYGTSVNSAKALATALKQYLIEHPEKEAELKPLMEELDD